MLREYYLNKLAYAFKVNPIVGLLGPRQCGKTTLAHAYIDQQVQFKPENYFDLEREADLSRLDGDPEFILGQLKGLVIIDEVQKMPKLFNTLRVLVDRPERETQFLILGSASRQLIQHSSDSLAGRISYIELTPFHLFETKESQKLFQRGGFPRAYLSEEDQLSSEWLKNYIRTYLEQDIPNLGIKILPERLSRFWKMLSHYHGNIFNASEIGRSLSLNYHTVQDYLDILTHTFMIRRLEPWFENINKRQVKSPKIYFRDSGILFSLLGIENESALLTHPKLGAAWEGFALEQVIQALHVDPENCFFWSTHANAEIDLIIFYKTKRLGFEFKYGQAVKVTRSMQIALDDLKLDKIFVIHAGEIDYPLAKNIAAISLKNFCLNPFSDQCISE